MLSYLSFLDGINDIKLSSEGRTWPIKHFQIVTQYRIVMVQPRKYDNIGMRIMKSVM